LPFSQRSWCRFQPMPADQNEPYLLLEPNIDEAFRR
jgi:hypothetical protein